MSPGPLAFAFVVAVLVCACGSSHTTDGTLTVTKYDTACQQAGDCIAVEVGPIECCGCPNAAINESAKATYDADFAAATAHLGVCDVACVICEPTTPTCSQGKCALAPSPDGGR